MGSREQAFCTQPKTSACAVVEYVAVSKRMFGLVAVVGPTPTAIRGCSTKEHSASTVAIETKDNEAPSAAA